MIYFRITCFLLATILFISTSIINASDISSLLEKKYPKAREVINKPTVSRVSELPHLPVSLRQYEFLIDHPHLSMALAQICDPSLDSYRIEVMPNGLIHVDEPGKLAGHMELVNASKGERVYFVSGHFYILRMRFNGHVILVMSYFERLSDAGSSVDSTTASYIKVNSPFVGFFTKIMDFLFPKKVDERIGRFASAVKRVATAVHADPVGTYKKLVASGEVGSEELEEFTEMFLK
jgi:hypothetical protein